MEPKKCDPLRIARSRLFQRLTGGNTSNTGELPGLSRASASAGTWVPAQYTVCIGTDRRLMVNYEEPLAQTATDQLRVYAEVIEREPFAQDFPQSGDGRASACACPVGKRLTNVSRSMQFASSTRCFMKLRRIASGPLARGGPTPSRWVSDADLEAVPLRLVANP